MISFVNYLIKRYDEVRKTATGQGDNFTTGWFCLFQRKLQINCCWFKQPKGIRCWFESNPTDVFTDKVETAAIIYYILEQSKETMLEFYKGTTKVL